MADTVTRVAIVDDDALVRATLATYLQSAEGFVIVHSCADGAQALAALDAAPVDVVLMDMRMPVLDGVTATAHIRRSHPDTRVLVLTSFDEDASVSSALAAGASGFLLKDTPPQAMVDAIRSALQGTTVVSPAPMSRLVRRDSAAYPDPQASGVHLSPRELEILALLCEACSNSEIAEALGVAESTVKTHVSSIMMKLGVTSRLKAVVRAYELGLANRAP